MSEDLPNLDTARWDPALDAVVAAPANHKVLFERRPPRFEITLAPDEEEPAHYHRWRSVFVLDRCRDRFTISRPTGRSCHPTGTS
jgi:hypothetical protein